MYQKLSQTFECAFKSDDIYFAENKQALLVFFIAHAEYNLIKLKLYNN